MKNKHRYPKDKYVIALTGGIATGKSLVSGFLGELGAGMVDTDKIAREVVSAGSPVLKKIEETWGRSVINPDGTLNRKKLGSIIFSSAKDREKLNSIIHPEIRRVMFERVRQCSAKIVFIDIPLLFESKEPIPYNESWLVWCKKEQQMERLMQRDGIDNEEALKRTGSQIDIDEKRKLADVIVENTGSPDETGAEVKRKWDELKKRLPH